MSWVRQGDTLGSDSRVLALEPGFTGPTSRASVLGVVMQLASLSALNGLDGLVDEPMLRQVCLPDDPAPVVAEAVRVGLLTRVPRKRRWQIALDEKLIHIRPQAEVDWEAQQRRDTANPRLTMPARERDGDACRYCARVVWWGGNKRSSRAGSYDHRTPGQRAVSPDDLVVACKECNSRRGGWVRAGWDLAQMDAEMPLLPVPEPPFYSPGTAEQLTRFKGRTVAPTSSSGVVDPARKRPTTREGTVEDPALKRPTAGARPADPALKRPAGTTDTARKRPVERPTHQVDPAEQDDVYATSWDDDVGVSPEFAGGKVANAPPETCSAAGPGLADLQMSAETRSTGRVGSGREGQGSRLPGPARPPGRGRGRRGRSSGGEL